MPFRKGQSGNPGGRSSDKMFRRALMLSLKEADGDFQKIRCVTDALVAKAIEGNVQAIALIADRIDGKIGSGDEAQDPQGIVARALSATNEICERILAQSVSHLNALSSDEVLAAEAPSTAMAQTTGYRRVLR